jgi:hypothetical protein
MGGHPVKCGEFSAEKTTQLPKTVKNLKIRIYRYSGLTFPPKSVKVTLYMRE